MFMSVLRQQSAVSGVFNRLRCLSVSMNARTVHASAHPVIYLLPTQTATEDVAALYSAGRELKDVHLISGTLGAGKSTFCRAYIRYACDDEELAVPSPTYTLLNTYEEEIAEGPPIHHLDLYRLNSSAGQYRLQIEDLWLTGSCLIEWPERIEKKSEAYFSTVVSTCSQGDAAALQEMAKTWGAVTETPDTDPCGGDCRWRVLAMLGHGIDVHERHNVGMQQLAKYQIDPEFAVVPEEHHAELLALPSLSDMAQMVQ